MSPNRCNIVVSGLPVQSVSVSISLCGRECGNGGGEEEGDAQRSFPHRRFGGSDAGSRLARETPVLEDREVKEYASWDAYAVLIDKSLRWLRRGVGGLASTPPRHSVVGYPIHVLQLRSCRCKQDEGGPIKKTCAQRCIP